MKVTDVERWSKDGVDYEIKHILLDEIQFVDFGFLDGIDSILSEGHYCGYCILDYPNIYYDDLDVDVHGGLTYGGMEPDGRMKYGFDCAHAGDSDNPNLKDIDWLKTECENMARQILEQKP